MKYIESPKLAYLTSFLTEKAVGDAVLFGRIEAFSCKVAGSDKRLSKELEAELAKEVESGAPPSATALGSMSDPGARKLLINLIATMNASFPDYDFSSLRADQFTMDKELRSVVFAINSSLAELTELYTSDFLQQLWTAIDQEVVLKDCLIISYVPDLDKDPLSEGALWSFNYFFYNRALKKVVFFTCSAKSKFRILASRAALEAGAGAGSAVAGLDEEEAENEDDEDSEASLSELSQNSALWQDDELF